MTCKTSSERELQAMGLMRLIMKPSLLGTVHPLHFPDSDYRDAVHALKNGDTGPATDLLAKLGALTGGHRKLAETVGPGLTALARRSHRARLVRNLRFTSPTTAPGRCRELLDTEEELEGLAECW